MTNEEYITKELERISHEMERLADSVHNGMVPMSLFEAHRTNQGERIGQLEKALRSVLYLAFASFVLPVLAGVVLASLTNVFTR